MSNICVSLMEMEAQVRPKQSHMSAVYVQLFCYVYVPKISHNNLLWLILKDVFVLDFFL